VGSENLAAQFTRDRKALAALEEKIRDVSRSKNCGTTDMAMMLTAAKMKYMDARQLVEQKWKEAHWVGKRKSRRKDGTTADFSATMATLSMRQIHDKLDTLEAVNTDRSPSRAPKNRSFAQTAPLAKIVKPRAKKASNMLSPSLSTQDLP
jgi:hypothetical protein